MQNTTFLFGHSFKKKAHTISALPGIPKLYYLEFAHVVAKQQPLSVQIVICFSVQELYSLGHVIGASFLNYMDDRVTTASPRNCSSGM